jgi:hypothetical protein
MQGMVTAAMNAGAMETAGNTRPAIRRRNDGFFAGSVTRFRNRRPDRPEQSDNA